MVPGDVVIFLNDNGETVSFLRGETNWTPNPGMANGYPTDEDISRLKESGRKWIHIRGNFIVGVNLNTEPWWLKTG